MFIAKNLKTLRKGKNLTQEEAAELLGVAPQSISRWERGESFPDITLLPTLANLYQVSVDTLIGMDKIFDINARTAIFATVHEHIRIEDYSAAVAVLKEALKTYPTDAGMLAELSFTLALEDVPEKQGQAITLCERALAHNPDEKLRHTIRAALCFLYAKNKETDKAIAAAKHLPHARECRETILAQLDTLDTANQRPNAYLRVLVLGE